MKQFRRLLILTTIAICSCSPKTKTIVDAKYPILPIVTLCDLEKNQSKEVFIKCIYSGSDEYWSLTFLKSHKCTARSGVELDFDKSYKMPPEFETLMAQVHNNYWNSSLLIEAIGIYETGRKGGYGHLGSNKSRFIISKIASMKFRKRR